MPVGVYKHHLNQGFQKGHKRFRDKESYKKGGEKISKAMKNNPLIIGKHHSTKTEFKKGENTGKNNLNWKGGITKNWNGYILVRKPKHPFSRKSGYILRSRLVAEKCLGRYLIKSEVIHHINGVKDDDRPENLYLFSCNSEHIHYGLKNKPILKSNIS